MSTQPLTGQAAGFTSRNDATRNDLPWIAGLGMTIALVVGLIQSDPLFAALLALLCALLALPLLERSTTLLWLCLPLVWFHHSSTGMLYSWLFFMALLSIELLIRPASLQNRLPEHRWLLVMAGASLAMACVLNGASMAVVGQWIWDFGILLLYVLITRLDHKAESLRRFVTWLLCIVGLSAVAVVAEGVLHPGTRALGFVDARPTGVAYNLCMFVPLALGAIRGTRLGWVAGLVAAVLFAAIFYTGSRAPFLAVILASLPFVMQYRLSLLAGGGALTAGIILGGGGLVSRVESFKTGNMLIEASTLMRLVMWSYAVDIIRHNPWTGVGLGRFGEIVRRRLPIEDLLLMHPHNTLLNKMVQLGIPLALLFFAIVAGILVRNYRRYRLVRHQLDTRDGSLTLGLLLAPWPMLICGATDSIFNGYAQPYLIWVMLAVQTVWMDLMLRQAGGKEAAHVR